LKIWCVVRHHNRGRKRREKEESRRWGEMKKRRKTGRRRRKKKRLGGREVGMDKVITMEKKEAGDRESIIFSSIMTYQSMASSISLTNFD
jgi:hypothetical protein